MLFDDRLSKAHKELENAGIWKSNFNPPILRFLRQIGLKIPPLYYCSFLTNFLVFFLFFGCAWGVAMWFFVWRPENMPLGIATILSLGAGILFGLFMALYYRMTFKKHNLSIWENLGPINN